MNNKVSGIYKIENLINGKVYIGMSSNVPKRWKTHESQLKNNKHHSKHLQYSWNKYGKDNFKFQVIEIVENLEDLQYKELNWILKTKSNNSRFGYNMTDDKNSTFSSNKSVNLEKYNIVNKEYISIELYMNLDKNEKLFYFVLRDFIQPLTNCIVIADQIPTTKMISNIVGLSSDTIVKVIKTLEVKGLIKRKQSGRRKAIYINPEYYSGGNVNDETLAMFGIIEFDDDVINEYTK